MTSEALAQPLAAGAPLSTRTRHALGVGGSALLLGGLGDALLRPVPWGVNLTLWCALLVACAAGLQRWAGNDDAEVGWIPVALVLATLMAWRDSPTLKALDLTALAVVLGLALHHARGGSVRLAGLGRYLGGLVTAALEAVIGAGLLLFRDVRWGELRREGRTAHAFAALRGVAIAAPLLLLFGALLTSADASFDRLVNRAFGFDLALTVSHLAYAALFDWLYAGYLRGLAMPATGELAPAEPVAGGGERIRLGMVETVTVLGLLDLLFLAFVVVQLPHFFGSYAHLLQPGTATFSAYARRGFFELCAVAALTLPLLMSAHWLVRGAPAAAQRVFRVAAAIMVGLVFVIIASGLHRMRLYQSAYGLTELRVYTTAFMLWLSAVFAWFCWTVLRDRRERFIFGALTAAVEAVVLLHVANPDALIVRVNAARLDSPVRFDALYATSLSGDAVPGLLRSLATVPAEDRCAVSRSLLTRWDGAQQDWRAWSASRGAAVRAVARQAPALRAMCPATAQAAPAAPGGRQG
jgi:hypothetical protein